MTVDKEAVLAWLTHPERIVCGDPTATMEEMIGLMARLDDGGGPYLFVHDENSLSSVVRVFLRCWCRAEAGWKEVEVVYAHAKWVSDPRALALKPGHAAVGIPGPSRLLVHTGKGYVVHRPGQ